MATGIYSIVVTRVEFEHRAPISNDPFGLAMGTKK